VGGPTEVVGVAIPRSGEQGVAVRARFAGRGVEARIEVVEHCVRATPESVLQGLQSRCADSAAELDPAALAFSLSEFCVELATEVAPPVTRGQVSALGLVEPGLWSRQGDSPTGFLPLGDAAHIAEATGISVIDAFAARDLAQGGLGGLFEAVPLWMLLHDAKKPRVLVDLGDMVRLTYLPASCEASGASRVSASEISPGMGLLDRLTRQRTQGRAPADSGGHRAVQGQRLEAYVAPMLAANYFREPPPRWSPDGEPNRWFFAESMRLSGAHGWALDDVLRSATHLVAQAIVREVRERVPKTPPLQQLIVSGAGLQNGLLLQEIAAGIPDVDLLQCEPLGVEAELIDAVSAATLAFLHIEQTPAANMQMTVGGAPRVLGRLTPGSPQSWQRLLRRMSANQPAKVPLRSAI
jgi:1,6-anhydro-N-acetylmuramate kinase